MKKVIIDNGHGVDTPGKRSPIWKDGSQLFEWEWTREIAKLIKERLDAHGIETILLVTEDKDISLSERANRCNKIEGEKILVSIHGNASIDGKAKGWELFSTTSKNNSDKLAKCFIDNFNYCFGEKRNRGHKETNYTLLYKVNCPCVLTENFFYDNEEDCKFMLSDAGKDAIVEMHVRSIIEYLGKN
jgi:N-acetylmuramoyl-L-alanine amidase